MIYIKYSDRLLVGITAIISLAAFAFFYLNGQQHLSYYDAVARLNTARKIIDSITPGLGQLGGVWLPFPQILFLPFIWNNFLWYSGVAGYIISGISFIAGALCLQKAVYALTKNRKAALLSWFLFVSNINILLLQSMALSEVFFFCFIILMIYFFVLWIQDKKISNFILTAFCVTVLTLTRYEGYFIFIGVLLAVGVECIRAFKLQNKAKIEGMLLLFVTVAGFGIVLWSIYSALFYKDPLFWLHAYTPPPVSLIQENRIYFNQEYGIINPTLIQSLTIISSVIFWTNGAITILLSLMGLVLYILRPVRSYFSILLIFMIFFILFVVGYYKGFVPHIEYPVVLLEGIKARDWSVFADNNVRYGFVVFPFLIFFAALAAARNKFLFFVCMFFAIEQLFFSFYSPQLLQYPFYKSWRYPLIVDVKWFQKNYDGGLVLASSSRHEAFMFQSGIDYKNFIYEGTRNYWRDSLKQPSRYAKWVVYNDEVFGDRVTFGLTRSGVNDLKKNYKLIYLRQGFHIYKLIKKG